MSRKIARCRARRDTRIATDSRHPYDSSFNRGRDKVLSLCNIGAENKLLRSLRYRDSSGSIATSKRDSRKGAFIASAESLHYFINPVGIENSSQQAAASYRSFPILETTLANELTRNLDPSDVAATTMRAPPPRVPFEFCFREEETGRKKEEERRRNFGAGASIPSA